MAGVLIRLRYPARCSSCHGELPRGERAHWDRELQAATCLRCLDPDRAEEVIERSEAGGSAAREWQRRHERRAREIRARHKQLGELIVKVTNDPRSTTVWATGARGERVLGARLERLRAEGIAVLHDRRLPDGRANIDHLVVSAAGVFVIDAKNYRGRVERRELGGWLRSEKRLYVGGRDRTKLVVGLARQVEAVRAALAPDLSELPLMQVICFVAADWPLFARPLRFGEVQVLWPRALDRLIGAEGPLSKETIARVERRLALALPGA